MNLMEYFKDSRGHGVMVTADSEGKVDITIYARPHVMDEETIAFIMPDRLTHQNLQSNPHAAYLFIEEGEKPSQTYLKFASPLRNVDHCFGASSIPSVQVSVFSVQERFTDLSSGVLNTETTDHMFLATIRQNSLTHLVKESASKELLETSLVLNYLCYQFQNLL